MRRETNQKYSAHMAHSRPHRISAIVPIHSTRPGPCWLLSYQVHQPYTAAARNRNPTRIPNSLYSDFIARPQLAPRRAGSVLNGWVVIANGCCPIDVNASGVLIPALRASMNRWYSAGVTARTSKFIIEW